MTLVLDGIPSSGGPRCLRSRGTRGFPPLVGSAESSWALSPVASFVVSVSGSTWPGALAGASGAGSVASPVIASPAFTP